MLTFIANSKLTVTLETREMIVAYYGKFPSVFVTVTLSMENNVDVAQTVPSTWTLK